MGQSDNPAGQASKITVGSLWCKKEPDGRIEVIYQVSNCGHDVVWGFTLDFKEMTASFLPGRQYAPANFLKIFQPLSEQELMSDRIKDLKKKLMASYQQRISNFGMTEAANNKEAKND